MIKIERITNKMTIRHFFNECKNLLAKSGIDIDEYMTFNDLLKSKEVDERFEYYHCINYLENEFDYICEITIPVGKNRGIGHIYFKEW